MSSTPSEWRIGDSIRNRWHVHDVVKGGMGIVYVVYDDQLDYVVAAKTFQNRLFAADSSAADRFKRESLAWINVGRHPHVTEALFVDVVLGKPYLFLEYVGGGDLGRWIGTSRLTCDLSRVLRFAIEFCDGIIHAMSTGIRAHRDIKPQNCLITDHGTLKITDFGLAKVFDDADFLDGATPNVTQPHSKAVSQTGRGAGTMTHMAPEQFDDAKRVDVRADVYSFGVMLYQMLTGRLPFLVHASSRDEAWERYRSAHQTEPLPALDNQFGELAHLVETCLAKDPADRFADFDGVRDHLDEEYARRSGQKKEHVTGGPTEGATDWVTKAASLGRLGRHVEAIRYCDRAIAAEPKLAAAWSNKGTNLSALGRYQDALNCFDHGLHLDHGAGQIWHNKGRVLITLGRRDEALSCLDRALELESLEPLHWCSKGVALGPSVDAVGCFDRAIELDPHLISAWSGKAQALDDLGRPLEALDCFDEALTLQPEEPWMLFNKGVTLARLGRDDEALTCFDRALRADPSLKAAWISKGNMLSLKGNPTNALVCFDEALTLDPSDVEALRGRADALCAQGDQENAVACIDQALALDPRDSRLWRLKGTALSELGRLHESLPCFDRALELDQRDSEAWKLKGISLSQLNRPDEGLMCFDCSLELDPRDSKAWALKGAALSRLGQLDESLGCFDRALDIDSSNVIALFEKGVALTHLEQREEARACFMAALRLGFPLEEMLEEMRHSRRS